VDGLFGKLRDGFCTTSARVPDDEHEPHVRQLVRGDPPPSASPSMFLAASSTPMKAQAAREWRRRTFEERKEIHARKESAGVTPCS
jgi:hypothetical protein